jgi:type VI protein secretion system component Hcp
MDIKTIDSKIWVLVLVVSASICLPINGLADNKIYLSLAGVSGEATNNLIAVDSFTLGMTNASTTPSFQNVSITKSLDTSSPVLALDCAKAQPPGSTAVLMVINQTSGNTNYMVTLGNPIITSVSTSGNSTNLPAEQITLSYTTITWTYQQLDGNGNKVGSQIVHGWNITKNTQTD